MNGSPEGSAASTSFFIQIDGKTIGPASYQTVNIEQEDLRDRDSISFGNVEVVGTMSGIEFNKDYLSEIKSGMRVDVVGSGIQLPPGKKMPKKKRLRKKWSKKYLKEFRFNNCELF